jgi:hypothetical protein
MPLFLESTRSLYRSICVIGEAQPDKVRQTYCHGAIVVRDGGSTARLTG